MTNGSATPIKPRRSLLETLIPASGNYRPWKNSVRIIEDVPYANTNDPKQSLDLVLPLLESSPLPCVVFAHGGMWRRQDRRLIRVVSGLYTNVGIALALRGIATAVIGYRQPPRASVADSLDDFRSAVRWCATKGVEHGIASDRIVVCGHSGGGHLAATLGLMETIPGVRGVASLGGVYDLDRLRSSGLFGAREVRTLDRHYGADITARARWSPERTIAAGSLPVFLGIAERDPAPLRKEFTAMLAACRAVGMNVRSLDVPRTGHMGLVLQMASANDVVSGPLADFVREVTSI